MGWIFALSPLLIVALGAILLMVAESISQEIRSSDLAMWASVTLIGGAVLAIAVWLAGPETLEGASDFAPYLIVDRFAMFFGFVVCLGATFAALFAGGYLPEHGLDRGEFYPLLLFSALGAMMLAAA